MKQGLRVEGVSFSYDGQKNVLRDVYASVKPGSFFGIVGPNGVGKTTLLRLISGYLQPQKGGVTLDGKDIKSFSHTGRLRSAWLWCRSFPAWNMILP